MADSTDPNALIDADLTPTQDAAIVALLNEPNTRKAAEACNVPERTLHRWLADPTFSAAYRKARRETFAHAMALTQRYAPLAVQTLASVAADKSAPHSSRVSASTAILKFSRDSIELDDLAARRDAGAGGESHTTGVE